MRLFALCIAPLVVACGDGLGPSSSQLQVAKARWAQSGQSTYVYLVTRSCFCSPESTGQVTVTVRDGVVESRVYEDGSHVPADVAHLFPDVPGMFAVIEAAIRRRADQLDVRYHSLHGFPEEVIIDNVEGVADDELRYDAEMSLPL